MHDDVGEILSDLTRPDELVDNAHDASKDSVSVSEPQPTRECKELGTLTAQRPIESSSDSSETGGIFSTSARFSCRDCFHPEQLKSSLVFLSRPEVLSVLFVINKEKHRLFTSQPYFQDSTALHSQDSKRGKRTQTESSCPVFFRNPDDRLAELNCS